MKYIYFFIFAFLLVLGWVFGVQNSVVLLYPISLRLQLGVVGFESVPLPLGGLIVLSFLAGVCFTLLGLFGRELHLRRELLRKKFQGRRMQKELSHLRTQVDESAEARMDS